VLLTFSIVEAQNSNSKRFQASEDPRLANAASVFAEASIADKSVCHAVGSAGPPQGAGQPDVLGLK